jgi:hypothetical protein
VARKGQALTSRDRTLWAVWSLTASALLWPRGANFPTLGVAPTRASLEERTVNVCVRWLWIRRSNGCVAKTYEGKKRGTRIPSHSLLGNHSKEFVDQCNLA